jgi:hypothetical protein
VNTIILFYITKVRGCGFYEREKRYTGIFLDILSGFNFLYTTEEITDSSIEQTGRTSCCGTMHKQYFCVVK